MPSTSLGIPYPDSTGHTRMWEHLQNLAAAVNGLFLARPKIMTGVATVNFTGGDNANIAVDLTPAGFATAPVVTVTARNSNYYGYTGTPSTTAVTVGARTRSGTFSGSVDVSWVAIGS